MICLVKSAPNQATDINYPYVVKVYDAESIPMTADFFQHHSHAFILSVTELQDLKKHSAFLFHNQYFFLGRSLVIMIKKESKIDQVKDWLMSQGYLAPILLNEGGGCQVFMNGSGYNWNTAKELVRLSADYAFFPSQTEYRKVFHSWIEALKSENEVLFTQWTNALEQRQKLIIQQKQIEWLKARNQQLSRAIVLSHRATHRMLEFRNGMQRRYPWLFKFLSKYL